MADVSLESVIYVGNNFFFLLSIMGNNTSLSMSYEALMWRFHAFRCGSRHVIMEGVDSFCRVVL